MSTDIIQAQYEQLDQIAARFGNQAESISNILARINRASKTLEQGDWEGRGIAAFTTEMNSICIPAAQRLIDALQQAQSTTLDVRSTIQSAEEEAASRFLGQGGNIPMGASIAAIGTASVIGVIANVFKGIAANTLLPGRYILRSLIPNVARGNTTVAMLMDMAKGKPGKGMWLLRFDGPHKGSPTPHINLNSKLTKFKDPHTPISSRLLNGVGRGARILQGARRIALPVAIGLDVFRLGSAYHSDGNQIGNTTKRTVGSVAGGWGGALGGAKVGAAGGAWIGGLIGSAIPVAGTAVGAGVGGFIGGLGGAIGGGLSGSWLGEKIGGLF